MVGLFYFALLCASTAHAADSNGGHKSRARLTLRSFLGLEVWSSALRMRSLAKNGEVSCEPTLPFNRPSTHSTRSSTDAPDTNPSSSNPNSRHCIFISAMVFSPGLSKWLSPALVSRRIPIDRHTSCCLPTKLGSVLCRNIGKLCGSTAATVTIFDSLRMTRSA